MGKRVVTVSDITLRFLELKNILCDNFFGGFQELLCEVYGNEDGEKISEGEFLDKVNDLGDFVDAHMCRHIEMKWGNGKKSNEI